MKAHLRLTAALLMIFPLMAFSAGFPWYAGVSGGVSSLRPETQNSPFTIDSSISAGGGAFVGYDFSKRISFELAYNYLGNATLIGASGKTDIGYTALSGGALMYVYGDAYDIAERNGFAGFLRLGMSSMNNTASIPLESEDNVAIWAGVGVEWPLSYQLNLRGELTSFDGDAQAARVSVLYRPRTNMNRAPVARPQTPTAPAPQAIPDVAPQSRVEKPVMQTPTIEPVTPPPRSDCSQPGGNEPTDAQGCALFSGKLRGVDFASGTASLTQIGERLLDRIGDSLLRYPNLVVEIQAHTESFGNTARAKELARLRSIVVARHLAGRGVPVKQLRARAFGNSVPVADDNTVAGRRQNNRIELRVLP